VGAAPIPRPSRPAATRAAKAPCVWIFQAVDPPQPTSVKAQATVQDVNRQAWSTSASILVHPANFYVGLKSQRTFVEKGQPLELSAIVTDLNGKPVSGKTVEINAYRLDWESSWGEDKVKTRRSEQPANRLRKSARSRQNCHGAKAGPTRSKP